MYEKLFFIGGLHRSGSTLLSSILCQNEKIHIEGKSALCQMMWDASVSIHNSYDLLNSNGKNDFHLDLISEIPKIYYKNTKRPIVFDKNPWWASKENTQLISTYINKDFKMLVLYRDAEEIIKSYMRIYYKNNISTNEVNIDLSALELNAKAIFEILENNNPEKYLFVDYDSIVFETRSTIKKIYSFLEIQEYDHYFNNISRYPVESSNFYGLDGLYEVRKKIEKVPSKLQLDSKTLSICKKINEKFKSYQGLGL